MPEYNSLPSSDPHSLNPFFRTLSRPHISEFLLTPATELRIELLDLGNGMRQMRMILAVGSR